MSSDVELKNIKKRFGNVEVIKDLCARLYVIAEMLQPILPETATAVKTLVRENRMPEKPLFLRKD